MCAFVCACACVWDQSLPSHRQRDNNSHAPPPHPPTAALIWSLSVGLGDSPLAGKRHHLFVKLQKKKKLQKKNAIHCVRRGYCTGASWDFKICVWTNKTDRHQRQKWGLQSDFKKKQQQKKKSVALNFSQSLMGELEFWLQFIGLHVWLQSRSQTWVCLATGSLATRLLHHRMHPKVQVTWHNIMLLVSYHAQKYHGVILLTAGLSEYNRAYSTQDKQGCSTAWAFFLFLVGCLCRKC